MERASPEFMPSNAVRPQVDETTDFTTKEHVSNRLCSLSTDLFAVEDSVGLHKTSSTAAAATLIDVICDVLFNLGFC